MTVCIHVYRGDPDGRTPEPGTHITRTYVCVRCGHRRAFEQYWRKPVTSAWTSPEIYHTRGI